MKEKIKEQNQRKQRIIRKTNVNKESPTHSFPRRRKEK